MDGSPYYLRIISWGGQEVRRGGWSRLEVDLGFHQGSGKGIGPRTFIFTAYRNYTALMLGCTKTREWTKEYADVLKGGINFWMSNASCLTAGFTSTSCAPWVCNYLYTTLPRGMLFSYWVSNIFRVPVGT